MFTEGHSLRGKRGVEGGSERATCTLSHLVKHGFSLVLPYFCSAPEAREQRAAWLWFVVHQPNLDSSKMSIPLTPKLPSPYTSKAKSKLYSAIQLCWENAVPTLADTQLDGFGGMNPSQGCT